MSKVRIVITGLGAITLLGLNIENFWNSLLQKKSGSSQINFFDTSSFNVHYACQVKNFDPLDFIPPKELRRIDLSTAFAFAATEEAIKDSKINYVLEKNDIGVIIGTGIGGVSTIEREYSTLFTNQNYDRVIDPFFINKIIPNISSSFVSLKLGLHGPSFGISSACSSSASAILSARNMIKNGYSQIMIPGGTEAPITPWSISNFDAIRTLSRKNNEQACCPWDATRDGFVLGEGAGILVLENLDHALKRNAKIYAELCGFGICSEAYHITSPEPSGKFIRKTILDAIKNSNLTPNDVDYLNLHATATKIKR
jgi:3-oxoacyl-[acyl-carrier-protein] synthase II